MRKASFLSALAIIAAAPVSAQDEPAGSLLPTTPKNVVAAVRDCKKATTTDGVSNEVLFASEWKFMRPMTEDGQPLPTDQSVPMRAYRKRGDHPFIIVDESTEKQSKQCRIGGGYAQGYDYERLVVALTKAFGAPQISNADGVRGFAVAPHMIAVSQKNTETNRQFAILVQAVGE